ncbi:MFS transporter [Arthrobacter sp. AL08]|uniref:MFS transporter n=1 Tax=Micrococcaceae TaxID=1268 RepID=UPI001CFFD06B|nr:MULTISPECIES: MFS transporter [Micrococcaceae]MCB5283800.1 Methyl viologen resistance protein SmvA [Arthrobacter sp. ES1]MDI3242963.1 MFS transporter [Arthrobacter sp. AL05]MDI3278967.1 MFS transporter [Arthrobacter sp. AL08]MDJ0353330.1 MFS transporter [Pseudarthrobacter sp. PH31-O2]WGZ79967.1 MFS transporter [Arthrobacter sp. EM1]
MSNTAVSHNSTKALGTQPGDTAAIAPPRAPWRDWLALALLMFPVLLVAVDNTALTFALPSIARSLDASGIQLLWIVDTYPLVLAGLLVAMGSLGDRIGRRRLLFIGSTGFAAVSAVTAFAPSAEWLIAGRAGLGFFGAMLMPSTLSLIRNIFPQPNRRRLAVAIWAAGFSGGAALGPIFGGWLVENFWWGAILLVAVPIILPLLALGPLLVPESRDPHPGRVDVPSVLLSLLVMVPVVYGIKEIATHGLAPAPLAITAGGLLMGYVFVRRQRALMQGGGNAPLLDISLFSNSVFSTAITANVLALFSFNGFILFLAQHLQLLEGQSPSESGVALVPALIATVVSGLLVVPLVRKVRPGFVVAGGLLLSAAGYCLVAFGNHNNGPALLLAALLVLCLGVGSAETISNDLILGAVPAEKSGAAAAISETGYEIGSLLGTAVLGSILTASYQHNLRLPAGVAETAPAGATAQAAETLAGAIELANTLPGPLGAAVTAAARTAFDSGVHVTAAITMVLMAGTAVLAAVALRKVPKAK